MRVTIEHREEAGGISGQRRSYFVDCIVEFSEEERAIIRARDLYDHNFTMPASTPLPSQAAFVGTGFLRPVGGLMTIAGPIIGIVGGLTKSGGSEGLGSLLFFGGIGLLIYGWRRERRQDNRLEQPEQRITVRQLLSNSRFTVNAIDPAHAKGIEDDIRAELVALKDTIKGSAELQSRQTFEL
jgi:hypothetical protein